MIKYLITMELDKRSRVWIVTFFTDQSITDDQLPDHCGDFVHAIQSDTNGSCSVFMKFKTLQSASGIQNLFNCHEQLVIKRSNWDAYESFKAIPVSSEVLRHGTKKHNDSPQDQPLSGQQHHGDHSANNTYDTSIDLTAVDDGYNTDDFIRDVKESRRLKRSIDQLQQDYNKIDNKIKQFTVWSRHWSVCITQLLRLPGNPGWLLPLLRASSESVDVSLVVSGGPVASPWSSVQGSPPCPLVSVL